MYALFYKIFTKNIYRKFYIKLSYSSYVLQVGHRFIDFGNAFLSHLQLFSSDYIKRVSLAKKFLIYLSSQTVLRNLILIIVKTVGIPLTVCLNFVTVIHVTRLKFFTILFCVCQKVHLYYQGVRLFSTWSILYSYTFLFFKFSKSVRLLEEIFRKRFSARDLSKHLS